MYEPEGVEFAGNMIDAMLTRNHFKNKEWAGDCKTRDNLPD